MAREYAETDTFRPATAGLLYSAYGASLGALTLSLLRHTWPLPLPKKASRTIGIITVGGGIVVALSGMSWFNSAAHITGIETRSLNIEGIYRHTRNPQYLGFGLMLIGCSTLTRSGLALAQSLAYLTLLDRWIRSEESHLTRAFGETYLRYQRETPRWL